MIPRQGKGRIGRAGLREKYLTVTFRFKEDEKEVKGKITWDCNEKSLDGFSPNTGWIRIDLTKLFYIHKGLEIKAMLQRKASNKPSLRKVLAKYSKRERTRAKDYIHKLTTFMANEFKGYTTVSKT